MLRARRLRTVVSEFEGLEFAPKALAAVLEHCSTQLGKRVVWISEGRAADRPRRARRCAVSASGHAPATNLDPTRRKGRR
jgi:hypothetical protein